MVLPCLQSLCTYIYSRCWTGDENEIAIWDNETKTYKKVQTNMKKVYIQAIELGFMLIFSGPAIPWESCDIRSKVEGFAGFEVLGRRWLTLPAVRYQKWSWLAHRRNCRDWTSIYSIIGPVVRVTVTPVVWSISWSTTSTRTSPFVNV